MHAGDGNGNEHRRDHGHGHGHGNGKTGGMPEGVWLGREVATSAMRDLSTVGKRWCTPWLFRIWNR